MKVITLYNKYKILQFQGKKIKSHPWIEGKWKIGNNVQLQEMDEVWTTQNDTSFLKQSYNSTEYEYR